MSFAMRNKGLKTISALQESTAKEEMIHYSFGIEIVNIIKEDYPQLWDEYLIELVSKNIQDAYKAELKLIDWFFENGVPDHLSKAEVVNFLNYNFSIICTDLGIDLKFEYDDQIFEDRNLWFKIKVFMTTEGDFFDNAVGGYSADDQEEELGDIFG